MDCGVVHIAIGWRFIASKARSYSDLIVGHDVGAALGRESWPNRVQGTLLRETYRSSCAGRAPTGKRRQT